MITTMITNIITTTTMNIITGYLASTEGEVLINGHNILEEPEEAKKCIGYLPELPPVYTDMTVLEYLKFVAELKKIPKDQRKKQILEVMNLVKITDMQNRLIKNCRKDTDRGSDWHRQCSVIRRSSSSMSRR